MIEAFQARGYAASATASGPSDLALAGQCTTGGQLGIASSHRSGKGLCLFRLGKENTTNSLSPSMEKAAGLNHDHTGSACVRMAIGQSEELRRFVGHAASIGRGSNRPTEPRPLPKLLGNGSRDSVGRTRTKTHPTHESNADRSGAVAAGQAGPPAGGPWLCWRLVLHGEHTVRIPADCVGKPTDSRPQGRRR
jgi:hypothetical protein